MAFPLWVNWVGNLYLGQKMLYLKTYVFICHQAEKEVQETGDSLCHFLAPVWGGCRFEKHFPAPDSGTDQRKFWIF